MSEQNLLATVLRSRPAWEVISPHVTEGDWTEQGGIIYEAVSEYYDNDPEAEWADPALICEAVCRGLQSEKHKDLFTKVLAGLESAEVSAPNVAENFIEARRTRLEHEQASALLSGDREKAREIGDAIEALGSLFDGDDESREEALQGPDLGAFLGNTYDPANLIKVYPESLNNRLEGGLKRGHHLVIFARPEMGKTMTVINMIGGFVQDGLKVLYIGNEDPLADIGMRLVNRLTGKNKYEVLEDLAGCDALARDRGWENIVLKGLAPGTPREITKELEQHRPDVLVLDQLRNLDMKNDHFTQALEAAAKQARAWAKRYDCVVVSVTQAGDSASGKSVLDLGDVDSSNTGIPATADVMLGIGATENHTARGEVVFSLPKNKVSGRHEFFSVQTHPMLSKLTSLE